MNKLYFSNVWEDARTLSRALRISPQDTVLTVASAGDNVLNLLLEKPARIVSVDFNPQQLSISKFKGLACKYLSHEELLKVLEGSEKNKKFFDRVDRYLPSHERLTRFLTAEEVRKGINNVGTFERRVVPILRVLASLMIRDETVFAKKNLVKQKEIFRRKRIWAKIFSLCMRYKAVYHLLMPEFDFSYMNVDIGRQLYSNLKYFFKYNDFSKNWYLQRMYYGSHEALLPPYLRPEYYQDIKSHLSRITFVLDDIAHYLQKLEPRSIDKINFSDIFDWCSSERFTEILKGCHRILRKRGRIFYKEFFVRRNLPVSLKSKFRVIAGRASRLNKEDNVPFYHRNVLLIKK